jgi:hypothetical protein
MFNPMLCPWVVERTEVFFEGDNRDIYHGKLASSPGLFWILCLLSLHLNPSVSIVKKRMRLP